MELLNLRADPAPLVTLVGRLEHLDLLAVPGVGEQTLGLAAGVVGHHGVGGGQDVARGAVVLLEAHHAGVRVVLLEVQDVLDVGAAPAVDRLVVVAHDHEVAVARSQQVGDRVLDVVGVLVLVHADLAEAVLVALQDLGAPGEQLEGLDEKVVEVHRVGAGETAVQLAVDARGGAVRGAGGARHLVGTHQGVLGRGDLGADGVERVGLLVDVQVGHDRLHQTARVVVIVDREVGPIAHELAILAQDAHAHGVEGADPHAARAVREQGPQALAHLGGSLVGERNGQDLPGPHALVGDHVGDAVREDARLARARAREHEQGAARALHGLALGGVEALQVNGGRLAEQGLLVARHASGFLSSSSALRV